MNTDVKSTGPEVNGIIGAGVPKGAAIVAGDGSADGLPASPAGVSWLWLDERELMWLADTEGPMQARAQGLLEELAEKLRRNADRPVRMKKR